MAKTFTNESSPPRANSLRPSPSRTHFRSPRKWLRPLTSRIAVVMIAAPLSLTLPLQPAFADELAPVGQEEILLQEESRDTVDTQESGDHTPGDGEETTDPVPVGEDESVPESAVSEGEQPDAPGLSTPEGDRGSDEIPTPSNYSLGGPSTLQTTLRVAPNANSGGFPETHLGEYSPGESLSYVLIAKNLSNTSIGSKSAPGHSRIVSTIGDVLAEVSASCEKSPANANVRCLEKSEILEDNVVQQNWEGGKNGTIHLTVNGTVPMGTPPGEYTIRSLLPSNFGSNSMNSFKPYTTSGLKTVGKASDIRETTVTFTVPEPVHIPSSSLTVSEGNRIADGQDFHTAQVSVHNQFGAPMSGVTVDFVVPSPLILSDPSVITDDTGTATATILSSTAGTYEVEARVNNIPVQGSPGTLTFIPGDPSIGEHGRSSITVSEGTRVADGRQQHSATATVLDAQGNPISGLQVDFFRSENSSAKLSANSAATNSDGQATVTATSTVAEVTGLSAKLGEHELRNSPLDVTFVAGEPSLGAKGQSSLTATQGDRIADGKSQHTVTATVLDGKKNPVSGVLVEFSVPPKSGATLSAKKATTDTHGVVTVSVVSVNAGTVPVSATVGGSGLKGSPVQLSFVPEIGDPSVGAKGQSTLTVSTGSKVADGKQSHSATATVLDAKQNPVPGVIVEFAVPSKSGASLNETRVRTNSQGVAKVSVTSVTAGKVPVSARVGGVDVRNSPGTVTFVADDPSVGAKGQSTLTVSTGSKVADGKQPHSATATVLDAKQNPVPGVTVEFAVPSKSGASLNETRVRTNSQGVAKVSVTSVTAGKVPVTARVGGVDVRNSPGTVTFVAGPGSVGEDGKSSLSVSNGTKVADGTQEHTATVTMLDAYGNPLEQALVVLSIPESSAGELSNTLLFTNKDGVAQASITSTTAGDVQVEARYSRTPLKGSPGTVTFVAGEPDASQSDWSVHPGIPVVADGLEEFLGTVIVRDQHRNPVKDANVSFTAPQEIGGDSAHATGADGAAAIAWRTTTSGTYTVSAALADGVRLGEEVPLVFLAGPADAAASTIHASPELIEANGKHQADITVQLRDRHQNAVSDAAQLTLRASNGVLSEIVEHEDGTLRASLTGTLAGESVITAHIGDGELGPVRVLLVPTPATPVLEPTGGDRVVGTADPGVTVTVSSADGAVLGTAKAAADGRFTVNLNPAATVGSVLWVTAQDSHGFQSEAAQVTVTVEGGGPGDGTGTGDGAGARTPTPIEPKTAVPVNKSAANLAATGGESIWIGALASLLVLGGIGWRLFGRRGMRIEETR